MQAASNQAGTEEGSLLGRNKALNYWKKILQKNFQQYDTSGDGLVDRDELTLMFKDMGLKHDKVGVVVVGGVCIYLLIVSVFSVVDAAVCDILVCVLC